MRVRVPPPALGVIAFGSSITKEVKKQFASAITILNARPVMDEQVRNTLDP